MRKLLLIVASSILVAGCSSMGNWFTGWNIINKSSSVTTEMDIDQTTIDMEANRPLTEEEKRQYKKKFEEGRELYKRKKESQSFLKGSVSLHYTAVQVPEQSIINFLKANNPKVCGIDRKVTEANKHICIDDEFMLLLARAYIVFPEFLIFEGLRSREAQKRNVDKGVSKTMNSRHLVNNPYGVAVDILGKDHKGKWSFQATDRIALAKGVIFSALIDLHSQGLLKCWEWEHATLWRFRDVYHVQLNRVKGCGEKITWTMKNFLKWIKRLRPV